MDLFRKEKLHNDQLARSGASRPRLSVHILQPVIVTTATLFLCDFDPAFVDLETGEIDFDKVTLQPASGLVYNYPLHADLQFDVGNFIEALDTQALPAASRSSIRVVQSLDFPDYLARAAVWFDDLWSDRVHIADDDSTPADVVPVTPPSN